MFNDETLIRRQCEQIAADMTKPLPAGDAGLTEAARRIGAYEAARRGLDLSVDDEDIADPILDPAFQSLCDEIENRPAEGAAGIAVKARYLVSDVCSEEAGGVLRQMAEAAERLAGAS